MKLYDNYLAAYILGGIAGTGFLYRLVWFAGILKFKKAAADLENTGDKSFVRLKNIFSERLYYNKKVNNVDTYVDKMLQNWCFCGLKLSTYSKLCGILMASEVISAVLIILFGMLKGVDNITILSTAIAGMIGTGALALVDIIMDCNGRIRQARGSVNEYLSNEYYYEVMDRKDGMSSNAEIIDADEYSPATAFTENEVKDIITGEAAISEDHLSKNAAREISKKENMVKELSKKENMARELSKKENMAGEISKKENMAKEISKKENAVKEIAKRENVKKEPGREKTAAKLVPQERQNEAPGSAEAAYRRGSRP